MIAVRVSLDAPMTTPRDEVTPPSVFFNRRALLQAGTLAGTTAATAALYRAVNGRKEGGAEAKKLDEVIVAADAAAQGFRVLGEAQISLSDITQYNTFYEIGTDEERVATTAAGVVTAGWKVIVDGLVHAPRTFDLADLRKLSPAEQRVYRMRCVEAWSMVIPWAGLPLAKLLEGTVVMDVEDALTSHDRKHRLALACQARPLGNVVIDARAGRAPPPRSSCVAQARGDAVDGDHEGVHQALIRTFPPCP